MDSFLQRMIHRFHEQVFQRMPPERKARKLAVMKALARSVRIKNKENENPFNNNMELPYSFTYSTPIKNQQVTDLDDIESDTDAETELMESELCGIEEKGNKEEEEEEEDETWREMEEPKLVISKIYDLTESRGESENGSICGGDESIDAGVTVLSYKELDDSNEKHWRSLEVLHDTAEYEFCRSLEESKLFVSTSSLLEEIEADLPSPYSLAKPLNHTFHTLTSYRTQTRLARMVRFPRVMDFVREFDVHLDEIPIQDANLTCPDILKQRESLEVGFSGKKLERLEMEATVQKALAEQAEKALMLSKTKKFFGVQHVESEKALLLANLRQTAALQEAKKVRMLGEVSEKDNFGQITISDICFDVDDSREGFPGKYICTGTDRENVQCTAVLDEVTDGKVHFKEVFKFQNLGKDFVIYVDLFKLIFKEPKKALMSSALMKRFKRLAAANLNKSLTGSEYSCCGFVCVSQSELRLENLVKRDNKCVLRNYLSGNLEHPLAGCTVSLVAKTDIQMKWKQNGFLNVFRHTWHRRWFCHSGYFLQSWLYPEDRESDKAPVESLYLPDCKSVEPVGLEVCVRPHSFVIIKKRNNEELLFSANSHKDMLEWIEHLNVALEQIRLWKPNL